MTTNAQKALYKIIRLCREPNHRVTRQLRLMEIALEGLGVGRVQRDIELGKVMQARRDRAGQHQQADQGGDHAAT
ncbi:hypothetical protein [Duganella violaceipulchra]|uniref:Uncharacterized protein n=1 Tax=Duganella violaceipulchra TaxID=2849652 RepID=A0AA41H7H4_9BURK|nr:hypothetical protein [Duganella violaceicalia]MBV6321960.1 hypothetical protein [Duganella violaceicalia]MCP2007045.1 hypothetical protein [Duganella violaceicalia]